MTYLSSRFRGLLGTSFVDNSRMTTFVTVLDNMDKMLHVNEYVRNLFEILHLNTSRGNFAPFKGLRVFYK